MDSSLAACLLVDSNVLYEGGSEIGPFQIPILNKKIVLWRFMDYYTLFSQSDQTKQKAMELVAFEKLL